MKWLGRNDQSHNERIQQSSRKEYKTRSDWLGKLIYYELSKKLKFGDTNKYTHNPEPDQENDRHNFLWDFWDTNGSPDLGQTTRPWDSQQKKTTCKIVDITVLTDHKVKIKENEKRDK